MLYKESLVDSFFKKKYKIKYSKKKPKYLSYKKNEHLMEKNGINDWVEGWCPIWSLWLDLKGTLKKAWQEYKKGGRATNNQNPSEQDYFLCPGNNGDMCEGMCNLFWRRENSASKRYKASTTLSSSTNCLWYFTEKFLQNCFTEKISFM